MTTSKLLSLQKQAVIKAAQVNFRMDYMRRIEIDGQPENFDTFVQDISYSGSSIESKTFSVGNGEMSFPNKKSVSSGITVIFKDDEDGMISDFISKLQGRIFNDDGTQNLPIEYLIELRVMRIRNNGTEYEENKWKVYVEENNEYGGDSSKITEHGTFSATFKKHKSFGATSK